LGGEIFQDYGEWGHIYLSDSILGSNETRLNNSRESPYSFIHSLFDKRLWSRHGGPSRWSSWGQRGGAQIVYGLDVGKGEMRFCGFCGLDTFHTEIVWCVPLQIGGLLLLLLLLRVLQKKKKKGNPKKQRSKESCIPTHYTTTRLPTQVEMQKAPATFEFWFRNFLGLFFSLWIWNGRTRNKIHFLLTALAPHPSPPTPLFSLSQILPALVFMNEWSPFNLILVANGK
jgi:hypothetical protein